MKVWQLVDASSLGGIERHVAGLVMALERHGHDAEVLFWARYSRNPWRDQLVSMGVPFRELDGRLGTLYSALRRERPDVLHTHGYKANLIGRLAARTAGVAAVSSFHAGERAPFPVSLYQRADEWTSFLARRIAVSGQIASAMPFPTPVVRNFVAVRHGDPQGVLPRRVGFVGRLSAEKGPDLFCQIADMSDRGIEWHVWGDGPMRIGLEARYGARIVFHGLTLDVGEAWRSIGLLLMPSRAEGLPMAALEALAEGIPILASRVGGLPDLVVPGETGWLFEAGDLEAAAARIVDWQRLTQGDLLDMRRACRSLVRRRYSDCALLPEILGIYASAVGDRARTSKTEPSAASPG